MTQGKKLSRREREKLRQRQEILDAALELFSRKGYHNVSMNEIAEKSEFAVGTLYNFFSNKEDIYASIMLEISDRFHGALGEAIETGRDEIEQLRNFVRVKGSVFQENVQAVRLYHSETRGASFNPRAGFDAEIRQEYDQMQQMLATIFQNGMRKKLFKPIAAPFHLAGALNGITNDFLFLWLEDPQKHPYPDDPDVILNILFQGLLARPATAQPPEQAS